MIGIIGYYTFYYDNNRYSEEEKDKVIQSLGDQEDIIAVVDAFMWGVSHSEPEIIKMTSTFDNFSESNYSGVNSWRRTENKKPILKNNKAEVEVKYEYEVGLFFSKRNEKFKKIIPAGFCDFTLEKINSQWKITSIGKP